MPDRRDLRLFLGFLLRLWLGLRDRGGLDRRLVSLLRLLLMGLRPRERLGLRLRDSRLRLLHVLLLGSPGRLARPEPFSRAHSPSDSNLRPWWCNLCPSLSRL